VSRVRPYALVLALLLGCADDDAEPEGADATVADGEPPSSGACVDDSGRDDAFADCVDGFAPAPGVEFGHDQLPEIVLGPPQPSASGSGSMDVASLGCGGSITLAFDPPGVVDGDGDDLIVFENAFASGEQTFTEPARVLVSDDGVRWSAFGCTPRGDGSWPPVGCAGVTPTLAEDDDAAVDPARAGGDSFDLADVGLDHARWVRLIDVTREHYGDARWCAGDAGGFDLDAIAAVPR
jgi:hypothetical protein